MNIYSIYNHDYQNTQKYFNLGLDFRIVTPTFKDIQAYPLSMPINIKVDWWMFVCIFAVYAIMKSTETQIQAKYLTKRIRVVWVRNYPLMAINSKTF